MKKELLNFLENLTPFELNSYFSYIKNKFKNDKKNKNFINLLETTNPDAFIKNFFKKQCGFQFKNENQIKIGLLKTEFDPVFLIDIMNNLEFNRFLKKIVYTNDTKNNQGSCFLFNEILNIIVISHKPYSGVPENYFKLNEKTWLNLSTKIRLEHELTHYYTKTIYGHATNNLHDELIADFIGISQAMNEFKAKWFIEFLQHKNKFQKCRFEIYVNNMPKKTKQAIFFTAKICANFIEKLSKSKNFAKKSKMEKIKFLCNIGIENMID